MIISNLDTPEPSIRSLLQKGRDQELFSAASWSVGDADGVIETGHLGTYAWDGEEITAQATYDLASVTKPIMGVMTMRLVEEGLISLDDTVDRFLPDFAGSNKSDLTIRQLLTHTSGMPGRVPMYRNNPDREAMIIALRELPLRNAPGEVVEYSSQGLMIIGLILEASGNGDLCVLLDQLVCGPAGLTGTEFRPRPERLPLIVATEDCPWRGRLVRGEVHDENAVVLGGVAGHAGLFSTADDLAALGRSLLRAEQEGGLLSRRSMAVMTRQGRGEAPTVRPLGWWGNDLVGSSSGDLLGPRAYGHTGFTGTSLWIDPDGPRFYVLLTNRVHPSRERIGFASVRRRFHNLAASRHA